MPEVKYKNDNKVFKSVIILIYFLLFCYAKYEKKIRILTIKTIFYRFNDVK